MNSEGTMSSSTESAHDRILRNIATLHRKYTVSEPNFFKATHLAKLS